ncbi:MAG: GH116 family glycosyl hydrolase [Sedimentisphaerales bacterium]|nr:GH116 family glycosyl hydrolase [Sedimentisphaerales bacterium]HNY79959.1 GH116 family glycosyl hydrolase [Sedimentisphaerales bacterium]HOC64899.1 GH116 family glycosyl hydrolase [Sedimentisphaerales bacterium]HOH64985.1 GH116 family glycosyl hydrolase [Sedimentisphaerales bacterium]HQA89432.1 GH116 family glycosyl hydrolase [Sedimentisphaerales bacterium]
MRKQRVISTLSAAIVLWVSVAGMGRAGEHLVPADKGLTSAYLQGLRERGQRAVYAADEADTLGMPVGGIATGQMYLRSDGTLGLWHIFNRHIFTGYGAECYRTYRPDSPVESGFAVVVSRDGTQMRKPLNRDFGTVECAAEYPIGLVRYRADGFPVDAEMEAFSPFIPLNAKDSALPATLFHIALKNTSDKTQEVSVLGWLENAVCFHSAKSRGVTRQSRITGEKGRTLLIHTAKEPPKQETQAPRPKIVVMEFEGPDYGDWQVTGEAFGKRPAHGTLANQQSVSGFLGSGLVNTYLGGDRPHGTLRSPAMTVTRKYINFLIGGGSHADETCINLLVDDQIVRTATGKDNEKLEWHFWNVEDLEGKTACIEILDRHSGGWGHINIDQIEMADEAYDVDMGPFDKLPDYGSLVLAFDGSTSRSADASIVMTKMVELAPGQTVTFTFVLSWFFPNHQNGHEYANRFDNASDVAHYVLDNHTRLSGQTKLWHRTFYEDSTLPRWLLFRLHSTVANLATGTCQWWKNGRFWAWEGVGCCEGTCTHVWNYAHAPARLFPELERSAREMQDFGEGFDPDSGLVGFRSNRAYAADGQAGTILKAYREHLCSADDAFLKRNWPRIKKAMEFSIGQDGDENGLIENSQHNTFDINFEGPNTFVGSMYLAALRAGEEMAREMGDDVFGERCRRIFQSGSRLTMERLWDGEYVIQLVDLDKHPKHQYGKGCLSDQLFGQGWAHQLGLNYIYPSPNVKEALRSIWKYNWAPDVGPYNAAYPPDRWFARPGEAGLFTCTWPKSEYLAEGVLYRNEVWTGIEYQVAGHMVWEGMVDEALAICRAVHDRYQPAKHNPFNEVECGDHYARAMASWGVFTALCGFEYHGPKGHIRFAPQMSPEDFRAAFTGAEGWGLFAQNRSNDTQRERIALRWGRLNLKTLAFCVPSDWKSVEVDIGHEGRTLRSTHSLDAGELRIELAEPVRLSEGQTLDIVIRR